jgi:cytosine deaminase
VSARVHPDAVAGSLELLLPRGLLDPRLSRGFCADADGLVPLRITTAAGWITAIEPLPVRPSPVALPLAFTPLVEPHAHLDKAFSGVAFPNRDGTMAAALAANQQEYAVRTAEQVAERAERALDRAWRNGLRAIRSHIDSVGPAAQASWEALLDARQRWRGRVELQLVALAPVAHWLSSEGAALARLVADEQGLLGGVIGPPYGRARGSDCASDREALTALLDLAERLGCGVDLHVDESDGHPGVGVDLVARVALERLSAVPITCSHASSMALLPPQACDRLADRLAAAEIAVVALPTTNFWLLGRRPGRTPCRRPLAPIRSLQRAGVRLALGGDNVQDPWYPGGDFDPVELLRWSAPLCQLMPWQRLGLAPFSTVAAAVLDLAWDGVLRVGGPADLVLLGAGSWDELLARPPQRQVLRAGRWLPPPEAERPSPLLEHHV